MGIFVMISVISAKTQNLAGNLYDVRSLVAYFTKSCILFPMFFLLPTHAYPMFIRLMSAVKGIVCNLFDNFTLPSFLIRSISIFSSSVATNNLADKIKN